MRGVSHFLVGFIVAFMTTSALTRWYWRATATRRRLRRAEKGLGERGYRLPEAGTFQRKFAVARHARVPWRSQADMDAGVRWLEIQGASAHTAIEVLKDLGE